MASTPTRSRPTSTNLDDLDAQKRPKSPLEDLLKKGITLTDPGDQDPSRSPRTPPTGRYSYSYTVMSSSPYPPKKRMSINVSGQRYELLRSTLEKYPESRLAKLSACTAHDAAMKFCDDYALANNEYFFERNPYYFPIILGFYLTGKLHLIDGTCLKELQGELEYWGLDAADSNVESCCQNKYLHLKNDLDKSVNEVEAIKKERQMETEFGQGRLSPYRKVIWGLLEHPESSWGARIVALVSLVFTLLAVISVIICTIPALQEEDVYYNTYHQSPKFTIIFFVCVGWFALEWCLRLFAAPSKWKFFKGVLNAIDLIIVLLFFIDMLIDFSDLVKAVLVLRALRIPYLLAFARFSFSVGVWMAAVKMLTIDILMLGAYMFIAAVIFGTWAFAAESKEQDTRFFTIPESIWWAIVTIATVGYGDMIPLTGMGKVIAMLCCFAGVFMLASVVAVVFNNFDEAKKRKIAENGMRGAVKKDENDNKAKESDAGKEESKL